MKEIDESSEKLLAAHYATCSETNIKTCNFCHWTFETKELFNAHIITCVSKPYKCQYCAEAVSTSSMVWHHKCRNKIALEDPRDENNENNKKDEDKIDYCPIEIIDLTDETPKTNNEIDKEDTYSCPIEIIDITDETLNTNNEIDKGNTHSCPIEIIINESSENKKDKTNEKVEKDKADEKKTRNNKKKNIKKHQKFSVWWKNKKKKKQKK